MLNGLGHEIELKYFCQNKINLLEFTAKYLARQPSCVLLVHRMNSPIGPLFLFLHLVLTLKKVVTKRNGGVGKVTNDRNWSWTAVIGILFSFKLAAILF
jgi:hypothetical protein